jgi:hypothetical protein
MRPWLPTGGLRGFRIRHAFLPERANSSSGPMSAWSAALMPFRSISRPHLAIAGRIPIVLGRQPGKPSSPADQNKSQKAPAPPVHGPIGSKRMEPNGAKSGEVTTKEIVAKSAANRECAVRSRGSTRGEGSSPDLDGQVRK